MRRRTGLWATLAVIVIVVALTALFYAQQVRQTTDVAGTALYQQVTNQALTLNP